MTPRRSDLKPYLFDYLGYLLLHVVLSPFLGIRSLFRAKRRSHSGIVWSRLSGGSKPPQEVPDVVIVAGGLGESRAALAFAHDLERDAGVKCAVLLNRSSVKSVRGDGVFVGTLPFNNPLSVLVFLRRWRPRLIAFNESWENHHLTFLARRRRVRTVVFNLLFSDDDLARVVRKRETWRWQIIDQFAVTAEPQVSLLAKLGIARDRVIQVGPLGLVPATLPNPELKSKWLGELKIEPDAFPILVAGSTILSDEGPCLEAFLALREHYPRAVLILAPRNLDRSNLTSALVDRGLDWADRRVGFDQLPASRIVLLNTYGELKDVYSIGTVAFVGGTFDPANGGHTPVEALTWRLPITMGPHFSQQASIVEPLISFGVVSISASGEELAAIWVRISENGAIRERFAQAADGFLRAQEGLSLRLWREIAISANSHEPEEADHPPCPPSKEG